MTQLRSLYKIGRRFVEPREGSSQLALSSDQGITPLLTVPEGFPTESAALETVEPSYSMLLSQPPAALLAHIK